MSTESHRSRKFMNVTVHFLDDSSHIFQLQAKNLGQILFDKVCKFLNLIEVDYFGLEFEDERGAKYWLDALKPLCAQMTTSFPTMHFHVKFYTPDPLQLEDEFTRYLFGLQIRKDISSGNLTCGENTMAVLISYMIQADFGDYGPEKCLDTLYFSKTKFVPDQNEELERQIMENHKKIVGQTPADADLNLLETARRCELYGIRMSAAKDTENVPLNIAVAHLGLIVFQNTTKINTFTWSKIRKLSFKRKKFLIKLHPEGYGYYKDTVEYLFVSRNECKSFWKQCIENHTFFRCTDAKHGWRQRPKIFSRGSSFRYSGRTQKQLSEFVRDSCVKRQPFQRSTSLRSPSSPSKSASSGVSPILPIAGSSTPTSEPPTPLDITKGLITPESEGTRSPDFFGDDTSHDSYDLLERETNRQSDTNCMTTNSMEVTEEALVASNKSNASLELPVDDANVECTKEDDTLTNHVGESPEKNNNTLLVEEEIPLSKLNKMQSSVDSFDTPNNTSTPIKVETWIEKLSSPEDIQGENENLKNSCTTDNDINDSILTDNHNNFGTSTFYISSPYAVKVASKKKAFADKSYCLVKELLMTERTYRKDLELINVIFREELAKNSLTSVALEDMLSHIDPLYEIHCSILRDLEQRLAFWEGRPAKRNGIKGVADIFLSYSNLVPIHTSYFEKVLSILEKLHTELLTNKQLSAVYEKFEAEKVCYLPITTLILKPLFRLIYYHSLLKDLLQTYNGEHVDYDNCCDMVSELQHVNQKFEIQISKVVNYTKLMELQRNLIGFHNLVDTKRKFIREGCLLKFEDPSHQHTLTGDTSSLKFEDVESHQHIFFLFSDILVYAIRAESKFQIKGIVNVCGISSQSVYKYGVNNCFILCNAENHLTVTAPSEREYSKWMETLKTASQKENPGNFIPEISQGNEAKAPQITTSIHICWHRNISVSHHDLITSYKHTMSGYLLRKFKSSRGWQKVWVVLANLCLFFYRSYLEDSPLACLPLAGYKVGGTMDGDLVHGDCILKLHFKNHEYFFMAENMHTFHRWMEAMCLCSLMEEENTRL